MKVKKSVYAFLFLLFWALTCNLCQAEYYNHPSANQTLQNDFSSYMDSVRTSLQKNWIPPDFLEEGHVRVLFKVDRNGRVLSADIIESSGDNIYDESAIEALKKAQPFGQFPPQTTRETLTINYSFDTSLVKTDKMKEYYELSKKNFVTDRAAALKYIDLAIAEVRGDDEGYFLYKRRGRIKEALGDHLGAREDYLTYESMKSRVDIKRVHALKHQAEIEDTAYAYFYLAYAYEQIHDYDNAIAAINKAIDRTDLNSQYKRYRTELVKKQL